MKTITYRLVFTLLLGAQIEAFALSNTGDHDESKLSLERRVWTSTHFELSDLENEVVRRIQVDPYDAFSFYLLSHLNLRLFTNSPQDLALIKYASEMAQQAIELSPKEDVGYIALAETLDLMGQTDKGIDLLTTASVSDVKPSWRYYFTLARLNAQNAPKEKVLGLLQQAMGFQGSQPDIVVPYVVAVLQTSSEGYDLISQLFSWDAKFPNDLFKQTAAIEFSNQGKYEDAHKIYKSLYQGGKNPEAQVNDAILLYTKLNQPRSAIKLLEDVLYSKKISSKDTDMSVVVQTHLGAALLSDEKPIQAEDYFVNAIKLANDKLPVIDFASKAYRKLRQAKHLSKLIERLTLETKPTGVLYAILGETQSEDLSKHNEALHSFRNAILLDPSRSDFYNGMGLTYYRMEKHEQALNLFREATKIDPNDATAMYNGACVLSKLGRVDESLGALEEALAIDPRLADHARTDKDFDNISARPEFSRLLSGAKMNPMNEPEPTAEELDQHTDSLSH